MPRFFNWYSSDGIEGKDIPLAFNVSACYAMREDAMRTVSMAWLRSVGKFVVEGVSSSRSSFQASARLWNPLDSQKPATSSKENSNLVRNLDPLEPYTRQYKVSGLKGQQEEQDQIENLLFCFAKQQIFFLILFFLIIFLVQCGITILIVPWSADKGSPLHSNAINTLSCSTDSRGALVVYPMAN